ncbi:hypothetical protein KA005_34900, partial [bacterium]|nr:hypothetical protein [bacterium]
LAIYKYIMEWRRRSNDWSEKNEEGLLGEDTILANLDKYVNFTTIRARRIIKDSYKESEDTDDSNHIWSRLELYWNEYRVLLLELLNDIPNDQIKKKNNYDKVCEFLKEMGMYIDSTEGAGIKTLEKKLGTTKDQYGKTPEEKVRELLGISADAKNLSNVRSRNLVMNFLQYNVRKTYEREELKDKGSFEFLVGEFKGSMTPEALIQAIKSNIEVRRKNTPIESLNDLLQRQDLYKVMTKRSDEVTDLINRLKQGKTLDPSKLIRLNRLILEVNHPYETPKSQDRNQRVIEFIFSNSSSPLMFKDEKGFKVIEETNMDQFDELVSMFRDVPLAQIKAFEDGYKKFLDREDVRPVHPWTIKASKLLPTFGLAFLSAIVWFNMSVAGNPIFSYVTSLASLAWSLLIFKIFAGFLIGGIICHFIARGVEKHRFNKSYLLSVKEGWKWNPRIWRG